MAALVRKRLKCYAEHGVELAASCEPTGYEKPDRVGRVCGTDSDSGSDDENYVSEYLVEE